MLTRSATLQQVLEGETTDTTSTESASEVASEVTVSRSPSPDTLNRSRDLMAETAAARAGPLRKRLERILSKARRSRDKIARQRDEETASTSDLETLKETQSALEQARTDYETFSLELYSVEVNPTTIEEDEGRSDEFDRVIALALKDSKYLISQRSIFSNISSLEAAIRGVTAAYEASPDNDHSTVMIRLDARTKDLEKDLHLSLMDEEEELRGRGNAMLEKAYAIQGRVAGCKIIEVKPATARSKTGIKLKHIEVPSFSGKTEDWLAFKRLFCKAVHHNEDLDEDTKLTYLVQAMLDLRVKSEMAERLDEPGAYQKIMAELEAEHDKPRWMHRRYCEQMTSLKRNPHTREGMKQLSSQVTVIINGLVRLKGEDYKTILTSIVEGVMDPKLRALWNQRTDSRKTTPPIEDLLLFINQQADQMEDDTATQSRSGEKEKGRQMPRSRGATHSVVNPLPAQPRGSQPHTNQRSTNRPATTTCPLCQGGHSLFYCPTFEGFSVAVRKEKVMGMKLCLNCLRPNHIAHDCNSNYRCRIQECGRKHNSLLHEDRVAGPTTQQPVQHQSNAATHLEDQTLDEEDEECLLMTAKVTLVGPTGKVITVRALLDAGSTLSIISSRLAKDLSLEKTGKEVVITGIKSKNSTKHHPMARVTLTSEVTPSWRRQVLVASMDEVIRQLPLQDAGAVRRMPHLKDLNLADDRFHQPGKVELLLGMNVWRHLFTEGRIQGATPDEPGAWNTVFGWTVMGTYNPHDQSPTHQVITHVVALAEDSKTSDKILARFQELEEPSTYNDTVRTPTEVKVEQYFKDNHEYDSEQLKYQVRLPRLQDPPRLGESKTQAINRARANERSLIRKGRLDSFQEVMSEYTTLNHSQVVDSQGVQEEETYYMPVHSVVKETSTTTKIRAVFDASAKTTSKHSFNDTLAVGPTLHPTIDKILMKFRTYTVAVTSDISKMYREVLLHPDDQPYHRYIWRPDQTSPWQEYQMCRLTFGVAASPYLAVKVLQQVGEDFGGQHPKTQWHIKNSFYVDDLLGGAETVEEATDLYLNLSNILSKASFHLRKWRSSSKEVLQHIPPEDQEALPTQELVDQHSAVYPKALGVSWDSREDTMKTSISMSPSYSTSKRGVVSDIARTFDVLGWIAPVILPMKLLYRELWMTKVDWDDTISQEHQAVHSIWREELPLMNQVKIRRHYFGREKPSTIQLHGFSDASDDAFGAVIYVRATYPTLQPTVELVVAKSKVAPLATRSTPQLELCGANLLARLMTTTRQVVEVDLDSTYAYTDSTIVLAWLGAQAKKYCIYSAHRISQTVTLIPSNCWRHVPGLQNPADVVSRGSTAAELLEHHLWWHGPAWLMADPVKFPVQPTEEKLAEARKVEEKPQPKAVMTIIKEPYFEQNYSSYMKLVRIVSWVRRFIKFIKEKKKGPSYLTTAEGQEAIKILVQRAQTRSFPQEVLAAGAKKPKDIAQNSKILILRPIIDDSRLLKVGGRLQWSTLPEHRKHPIILSSNDHLTLLLFRYYHLMMGHCGPSTIMAQAANIYIVVGGKTLAKKICSTCIICRKQAARASSQLLGQLPPPRVEPHYVFLHTGMDFAGPFPIRRGYTRSPTKLEAHLALFVCFATRAVHLELVLDQKTDSFLAALDRFIDRRGLPLHLYSDNGPNYTGAKNRLSSLYKMLASTKCQDAIQAYTYQYQITWHSTPQRAPHFGGLWEAAVKSAKYHLRRILGSQLLTFEELSTICCNVESFLNSRPLGPVTSHDLDGLCPLTPSHFLIGRAARAYPTERLDHNPTTLQRWDLCRKASQDFWDRWSQEYLQQLQKATKWHRQKRNYSVGDLVMLTDGNAFHCQWTMAKVIKTYPGRDGLVRAVDVQLEHRVIPKSCTSKAKLIREITTKTSIFRRPISKLALLMAVDEGQHLDLDKLGSDEEGDERLLPPPFHGGSMSGQEPPPVE